VNALSKERSIKVEWLEAKTFKFKAKQLLKPSRCNESPDIIIGAGHRTHKSLLCASRAHRALSFVIMKPSLPLRMFDGVICPEHDGLKQDSRVFNTEGPINKISRPESISKRERHLIMIGGPSKHFIWDEEKIIRQIQSICQRRPEISWSLSNSPRTPSNFLTKLQRHEIENLEIYDYQSNGFGDIESALLSSAFTWLTPDSMSMIYESLTAGSPSALLKLDAEPKAKNKRICQHISKLLKQGIITGFDEWQKISKKHFYPAEPHFLDEASNAARWLLSRYESLRTK
jgi:mitochondrial fission protein ELM1